MIIPAFIEAVLAKDYQALARCFNENAHLCDLCPTFANRPNTFLFGQTTIEMFYRYQFFFGGFSLADHQIIDDQTLDCYISYHNTLIHARASFDTVGTKTEGELIHTLTIRPD